MPNFWALENLQKGKQVCRLNFNRTTRTEHYQESSDCCCSYLNQATKKNTCQVLLPKKKSRIKFFFFFGGGRGAFWSEKGSRLCLSGMVFEGTTGVYERIYHFCFKCLRKKEKYVNSKWILKIFFVAVLILFMRGAYLLLVPQKKALISLLRNNRMLKTKL